MKNLITCIFVLVGCFNSYAQSLIDGFTQQKGELSAALSYSHESYDEFYFGDTKMDLSATGLEKIIKQSVNAYLEYGLTNKLGVVVSLPYISAKSDVIADNSTVSEDNIQDASVFLEWNAVKKASDAGTLSVVGAFGVSFPLSDYATDVIYAIGNHATTFNPKAVIQYKLSNGIFAHVQGGYGIRTGDVPNVAQLSAKIGYAAAHFYVDGYVSQQWSNSGIDIGGEGFTPQRFPETQVNTTNLGLTAFVPLIDSFGVTAGVGTRVKGRNAGLPTFYTLGVVFHVAGN